MLNPPSSLLVEDNGFHPLINMAELKLAAVSQTTIAQRSGLASHRELARAPYPRPEMFPDWIAELTRSNLNLANFHVGTILDPSFVQNAVDRGLVKP